MAKPARKEVLKSFLDIVSQVCCEASPPFRAGLAGSMPVKTVRRRGSATQGQKLNDLVCRLLYSLSFAAGATTWPGESFSLLKNIPANKTSGGDHDQSVTLGNS
jgi:hypothetical protein